MRVEGWWSGYQSLEAYERVSSERKDGDEDVEGVYVDAP